MIRGGTLEIRVAKQRRSRHINMQLLIYTLQSEIKKSRRKVLTSRVALRTNK